jgi:hypothetical protein
MVSTHIETSSWPPNPGPPAWKVYCGLERRISCHPDAGGISAYAFAETLGWRQRLEKKWKPARAFYVLIFLSMAVDVGLDFVGTTHVKGLYSTDVINALLAAFFS